MITHASPGRLRIVVLGLSITSSWGNGHATTYRGLVKGLTRRGHDVLFLERDVPWYAENRDLPVPPHGRTRLYRSLEELRERFGREVAAADLVVVGSYVPEGVAVGEWVVERAGGLSAFYDIDTPVTLAALSRGGADYLAPELVPRYGLYLSFTGGPTLRRIERVHGSPRARALYCSVDPDLYVPEEREPLWDLGYMGTYSADRQPTLDELLLRAARRWRAGRFVVAGPQYPAKLRWPGNVARMQHLPPSEHRAFYNAQRFTLNVTRRDMVRAGWSPSVRLFEAAACGTPVVSDAWSGLDEFFRPGAEILVSRSASETLRHVRELPEEERRQLGRRARARVLAEHTAEARAEQLEGYALEALGARA
ncbi:MAG: glycosyltransferase [Gemmatimonadota bacterium]